MGKLHLLGTSFTPEMRERMADSYDESDQPEMARIYRHTHEELLRMCVYMFCVNPDLIDDAFDYLDEVFGE